MDVRELLERLHGEEVFAVPKTEFEPLSAELGYERTVDTGLAGHIHVLHSAASWAVIELPPCSTDVAVRPLADEEAVELFIADRLALYEKMWDGCGCRPDYWGPWRGAADTCGREEEK